MTRAILGTRVDSPARDLFASYFFLGIFLLFSEQLHLNGEAGSFRNVVFVCWVFEAVE